MDGGPDSFGLALRAASESPATSTSSRCSCAQRNATALRPRILKASQGRRHRSHVGAGKREPSAARCVRLSAALGRRGWRNGINGIFVGLPKVASKSEPLPKAPSGSNRPWPPGQHRLELATAPRHHDARNDALSISLARSGSPSSSASPRTPLLRRARPAQQHHCGSLSDLPSDLDP